MIFASVGLSFDYFNFSYTLGRVLVSLADGTVAIFHRKPGNRDMSCKLNESEETCVLHNKHEDEKMSNFSL